jgi:Putative Actinobacterial Holin-X, holin superfamily III
MKLVTMAVMQRANENVVERRSYSSNAQWLELVSRAANDLSRIVHAELRLAELRIKSLIEQETDRSVKVAIALGFLLCATVCTLGTALIGLHAILGLWWAALAIIAAISGTASIAFFLSAKRRPESGSSN